MQSVDKVVYEKILHKSYIIVAGPAELSWSGVQRAEALWSLSARGEFQISPVECFERGDALQERASP